MIKQKEKQVIQKNVLRAYREGLNAKAISKLCSVSMSTVYRWTKANSGGKEASSSVMKLDTQKTKSPNNNEKVLEQELLDTGETSDRKKMVKIQKPEVPNISFIDMSLKQFDKFLHGKTSSEMEKYELELKREIKDLIKEKKRRIKIFNEAINLARVNVKRKILMELGQTVANKFESLKGRKIRSADIKDFIEGQELLHSLGKIVAEDFESLMGRKIRRDDIQKFIKRFSLASGNKVIYINKEPSSEG